MIDLIELLWPYLTAALVIGFLFGWLYCRA